jgi:hypothetical protein
MAGYHLQEIPKAEYGTAGKVIEEAMELQDAFLQGVRVMELQELADLYGAIQGYLERRFPDFTMKDLAQMAEVTARAFQVGARK